MKVSKYRITISGREGSAFVVYHDDCFKSFINEFKPPLNDTQLNWTLSRIPSTETALGAWLVDPSQGKVHVEYLSILVPDQVLALFCRMYEAKTGVKYKVSASDAGKIARLCSDAIKWQPLLERYFKSENFLFKGKYSVANLVKYFNELTVETFGIKPEKTYPLPYDQDYFTRIGLNEQREYWAYLRKNGYVFQQNSGRGGKWVKKEFI